MFEIYTKEGMEKLDKIAEVPIFLQSQTVACTGA